MINNMTIPTSAEFIDEIARVIAQERLKDEIEGIIVAATGQRIKGDMMENMYDEIFNGVWNDPQRMNDGEKEAYRDIAQAVINAINLKLITG